MSIHKSVMLDEVIEYLDIKPGARIVDATLNGGGHTDGIFKKYPDVKILGIEWDPDIFQEFQKNDIAKDVISVNDSYVNLKQIMTEHDFQPDGVIFDLGVSSWHYEGSRKGFSFMRDEILDMRFNPKTQSLTAADIVNKFSLEELEDIFSRYGEEKFSSGIARKIVSERSANPIVRTDQLVAVILASVPGWYRKGKIHPATKTFQALRIAVNGELENVEKGVLAAIESLKSGGRLVVISFHGLEDKIVREIFKQKAKEGMVKWVIKGTIKPKWEEVKSNPRARSAKMKIIEKI